MKKILVVIKIIQMKAFAEVYIYTRILGYLNAKYLLHRITLQSRKHCQKKKNNNKKNISVRLIWTSRKELSESSKASIFQLLLSKHLQTSLFLWPVVLADQYMYAFLKKLLPESMEEFSRQAKGIHKIKRYKM